MFSTIKIIFFYIKNAYTVWAIKLNCAVIRRNNNIMSKLKYAMLVVNHNEILIIILTLVLSIIVSAINETILFVKSDKIRDDMTI